MKNIFSLGIICTLMVTTLLFSGCSNGANKSNNPKGASDTTISNDVKSITDIDLINSDKEDPTVQLDSIDTQSQELSTEEIDLLLNDNSDFDNISSDLSAK